MTKKLEETKKLNRKLYPCSRKKNSGVLEESLGGWKRAQHQKKYHPAVCRQGNDVGNLCYPTFQIWATYLRNCRRYKKKLKKHWIFDTPYHDNEAFADMFIWTFLLEIMCRFTPCIKTHYYETDFIHFPNLHNVSLKHYYLLPQKIFVLFFHWLWGVMWLLK